MVVILGINSVMYLFTTYSQVHCKSPETLHSAYRLSAWPGALVTLSVPPLHSLSLCTIMTAFYGIP